MGRELGTTGEHPVNTFTTELDRIEEDARPYLRTFGVRARRFVTAFVPVFLSIVITNITSGIPLTVPLLWGAALSVAVTVLGEIDPSIPWSTLVQLLDKARYRSDEPLTVARRPPTSPPRTGP